MIDLTNVYSAVAAWEQFELVNAPITRAGNLIAYTTYPKATDMVPPADILTLPFTCHWGLDTKWGLGAVRSGNGQVEDLQKYTFASGLLCNLQDDPLDVISERDALWKIWYRVGFLKHLQLGIVAAGEAHSVTMEMLDTFPLGRNLFGVQYAGIMSICTATIRQSMQTGMG